MASKPENGTSADDRRKARLASALRENLKRRKAQVRGRREEKPQVSEPEQPEPGQPDRG
jgi:hypothetical protein